MYNKVNFIVSTYLNSSVQCIQEVFEYVKSICVVPCDTYETLLDSYCLITEIQCTVLKKIRYLPSP